MPKSNETTLFSNECKEIISYSKDEAIRLKQGYIDTSALFLGIVKQKQNQAYEALSILSLNFDLTVREIERQAKPETNDPIKLPIPLTKQAEKVIRGSVTQARAHEGTGIISIDLLLSILEISDSMVGKLLNAQDISYESVSILLRSNSLKISETYEKTSGQSTQESSMHSGNTEGQNLEILIERRNRVSIREIVTGVLNVQQESAEIATLLTSLGLDQGMMFGLFGRWGRGKTFFWKNIWSNLESNSKNPFVKVEFHAWKYQDTPATWAYLYETMADVYFGKPSTKNLIKWGHYYKAILILNYKRKGLVPILIILSTLLLGTLTFFLENHFTQNRSNEVAKVIRFTGLPASLLLITYSLILYLKKETSASAKDIFMKYSKKYSANKYLGIQGEIQKEIVTLLNVWIPAKQIGKKRILLFIDDIDRCSEEKVIQIIDSIRIMLDEVEIAKKMVVVAAIDERILELAIANKYQNAVRVSNPSGNDEAISLGDLVKEYMDKLFIGGIKLKSISLQERNDILNALASGKVNFGNSPADHDRTQPILTRESANPPAQHIDLGIRNILEGYFITYQKEPTDDFELEAFELRSLQEAIAAVKVITPRMIRIFYYRYLLARRFLFNKLFANKALFFEWNDTTNDKSVLPFLILHFSLQSAKSLQTYSKELLTQDKTETAIASFSIFQKMYNIKRDLLEQVFQIVEIVVPY